MRLESASRADGDNPHSRAAVPTGEPEPGLRPARRRREQEQWQARLRLERQLHDGAALRISALSLQLGLFAHRVPAAEPELRDAVGTLQDELAAALQELRDVAAQIYPPLLDEAGLGPALRTLVERLDMPVRVVAGPDRFGAAAEGAVYFALADALAVNAEPLPAEVRVTREAGDLVVAVDGGGADLGELLRDRAHPLGGVVTGPVPAGDAAPGTGTTVVRIPCV